MSALCQLCGLPMFEGAAGYVGPQCRCLWVRLPKMQDAIEADDGARALPPKAHHAAPFLEMRIAELEAEVNRLNTLYDEIELRALMSKDSSGNGRTLLERLESNFTELCDERDKAKRRIAELERENAVLQARIDELMLEHCPDEMSAEQIDNYAKHQCPVSAEEEAAVNAAIAKIKEAS